MVPPLVSGSPRFVVGAGSVWMLALLVWCVGAAFLAGVLLLPVAGLPAHHLGLRGFQTPELTSGIRISQTFTMTADGLRAITFQAVAVDDGPTGGLSLGLYDITPGVAALDEVRLRAARAPAAAVVPPGGYRFEFEPIAQSAGRRYRLDLEPVDELTGGVAFRATRGDGYVGGALLANGTPRWADLVFEADAVVPSYWNLLSRSSALGSGVPQAYVVVPLLLLYWCGIGVVLWALERTTGKAHPFAGGQSLRFQGRTPRR